MLSYVSAAGAGVLLLFAIVADGQEVDCMGSLMTLAVRAHSLSSPTLCFLHDSHPRSACQTDLNSFCCNGGTGLGGGHRRAQAGACAFTDCTEGCAEM